MISLLDLAKAVLEERDFENRMLKNHIKNWPDEPQAWLVFFREASPELVFAGGGSGIRTLDAFRHAGFQDRCNRPLCQTPGYCQYYANSVSSALAQPHGSGMLAYAVQDCLTSQVIDY